MPKCFCKMTQLAVPHAQNVPEALPADARNALKETSSLRPTDPKLSIDPPLPAHSPDSHEPAH